MAWVKGKSGGQTIWTNTDTHETWFKGKSGGATTWSNSKETWFKGKSGGATTWTSNKRNSTSFKTFMDEDDD